jgi:hypothetical protein
MRKVNPYVRSLKKDSKINAGQVIGYVGSTGESNKLSDDTMPENENAVDGKFDSHLHIGVYKKVLGTMVSYNPFPILEVVKSNKVVVEKAADGDYVAKEKSVEERIISTGIGSNVGLSVNGGMGSLSAKYESTGSPGTISNTKGDPGGKSYGVFQFASNMGSLNGFLMWLSSADANIYSRLMEARSQDGGNGSHFDAMWVQISNENSQHFYDLQYTYIKSVYFDPVVAYFKPKGLDIEARSKTLQNVVWSTSVQHGVGGAETIIGLQNLSASDREIIIGIYNERMKVDVYFNSSSPSVRQAVYNRFERELQDALAMLGAEGG